MGKVGLSIGLFVAIFGVKFLVSLINQSYFIPDEVWQSQEVAHFFVFGQGFLTWEWQRKIRSFAYPFFLACFYWALKAVGLDSGWSLQVANKVFGSLIAASTDFIVHSLALEVYGKSVANCALLLSLCNSFTFTHQTRTLTNNFESLLNVAFWHCWTIGSRRTLAIYIAAFGCVVRPTFAINCIVPLVLLLVRERKIKHFVFAALFFLAASLFFDYAFYGEWLLLTCWNFCKFNAIDGLSSFYGTNGFTWYFWSALPVMSNIALLPLIYKAKALWSVDLRFRGIVVQFIFPVLVVYSVLKHKEVRFIFQLQPFLLMFCACALQKFTQKGRTLFWLCYLALNIPIAVHFACIHQVGPLRCLEHVESLLAQQSQLGAEAGWNHNLIGNSNSSTQLNVERSSLESFGVPLSNVFFLTSCHVSPYYGYFHNSRLSLQMITCNPPERAQELSSGEFKNEMLLLFDSPLEYTIALFAKFTQKPHILIVEDALLANIKEFLTTNGYTESRRFPRSLFSLQDKTKEDLIVFKLSE